MLQPLIRLLLLSWIRGQPVLAIVAASCTVLVSCRWGLNVLVLKFLLRLLFLLVQP